MPPEPARCTDVGFRQRLFEEAVDHEVRAGHVHKHQNVMTQSQSPERLRSVKDHDIHGAGVASLAAAHRPRPRMVHPAPLAELSRLFRP